MSPARRNVPVLLWPAVAVWRFAAFVIGATGRLLAVVLGLVMLIAGVILSFTIIGAIAGIPLSVLGFLLIIRGFF